ncbi:MAG: GerMN domain-containing protein [Gammaproteobacteria bacterium]|nr:GerMN domain-containing protein [Gammaproteobacteria bacterium]
MNGCSLRALAAVVLLVVAGCEAREPDDPSAAARQDRLEPTPQERPAAGESEPQARPEPERGASPETGSMTVEIYFTEDERPRAVERRIPRRSDVLTAALEQLLRGPTDEERAAGISSWFSSATAGMLNRVVIDPDGHAIIDFGDFRPVIPGASSSFGSTVLLAELNGTVGQFERIVTVEYQIDGSCHRFWQFLQRPCEVLTLRR